MAALRSPRDSLNTPKMLMTPIVKDDMLSTPTLTTPRPSDWGPFSPAKLSSCSSSPGVGREHRDPPSELPLDSSIGNKPSSTLFFALSLRQIKDQAIPQIFYLSFFLTLYHLDPDLGRPNVVNLYTQFSIRSISGY